VSNSYILFLENIVEKENIDLIFFGTEQEIIKCSRYGKNFKYRNKCVINNDFLIELAQDKWNTYEFLKENQFQTIPTFIEGGYDELSNLIGTEMLLKPRDSYASKGIIRINSAEEYNFWKKRMNKSFMVQKIVGKDNDEYTASVFGYGDGTSTNCICFRRKLGKDGATRIAEVNKNKQVIDEVQKLTKILKPLGPTNYQFRIHNNRALLLEINPRISSFTSIRTLLGYNESELSIEFWLKGKKIKNIEIKQGKVVRYLADIIL